MRIFSLRMFRLAGLACAIATTAMASPAGAIPYEGAPNLQLTSDLVAAGSGPKGFDSHLLIERMYGPQYRPEIIHLRERYGATYTADFFTLMNYSIDDVAGFVTRDKVALPKPESDMTPAKLDYDLVAIGQSPKGSYDVGYMLEKLISHKYHEELMMDLNMHFSQQRVSTFHAILGSLIVGPSKET